MVATFLTIVSRRSICYDNSQQIDPTLHFDRTPGGAEIQRWDRLYLFMRHAGARSKIPLALYQNHYVRNGSRRETLHCVLLIAGRVE